MIARLDELAAPLSALRLRPRPSFPAALDDAVEEAYARFAARYVRWADSLFDRHFLRYHAADTLVTFAAGRLNAQQATDALVAAWEREYGAACLQPGRCHTELAQAASVFVSWVAQGLKRRPQRRLMKLLSPFAPDGEA